MDRRTADSSTASWRVRGRRAPIPYTWQVYGADPSSNANFPGQTVSYSIEQGWALAGATFFFRLLDVGFSTFLIPIILFSGVLYAVWIAKRMQSVRPILVHGLAILLLFPLFLWPSVIYQTPTTSNVIYQLFTAPWTRNPSPDDPPADAPRVSPFLAAAFSLTTDIAQRIGDRLSWGNRGPASIILQASLDARLDDGDYDTYMEYASMCMTAVRNVTLKRSANNQNGSANPAFKQLYDDLTGPAGSLSGNGNYAGSIGAFNAAPVFMKHGLSPFADAMFKDLWVQEWVWTGQPMDRDRQTFDGLAGVHTIPKPYSFAPNPLIGAGDLTTVHWDPAAMTITGDSMWTSLYAINEASLGVWPSVSSFSELFIGNAQAAGGPFPTQRYVPFCSVRGMDRNVESYDQMSSSANLPAVFSTQFKDQNDLAVYRPVSWDDTVRARIAHRYLNDQSITLCQGVSPDRQNKYLWGCLLAGRYTDQSTPQTQEMAQVQQLFDSTYRPILLSVMDNQIAAAGGLAQQRNASSSNFWYNGGTWTSSQGYYNPLVFRQFCDLFFLAPGVQSQVGLFGDYQGKEESAGNTDSWFFKMLTGLGGAITPTVVGVFAWIATVLAKIALMIYPHAMGIMTFLIMVMALPYLVRGCLPGQYFYPLELGKAIVLLSIMPIFQQFGLSLMEQGNGMSMATLLIRTTAGGEFGESLCQLLGAMFIISSFSLAAGVVAFGFGSLAAVLGTINANAFKLTGAGAAGIMTVAGIGAAALTGGASMLAGGGARLLTGSVGGSLGGTGSGARLPGPGPGGGGGMRALEGGAVRRAVGSAAVGDGAAVVDTGTAVSGTRVVTGRSALTSASAEHAAAMIEQAGGHAQHLVRGVLDTGLAAASATAHALEAGGPIAGHSGTSLAHGASLGRSTVGSAADTALSGARALGLVAGGATGGSVIDRYAPQRTPSGDLRTSVPTDERSADEFARIAQSFAYESTTAEVAHDDAARVTADLQAGRYFRDASHLAQEPQDAAAWALQSAAAYRSGQDPAAAQLSLAAATQAIGRMDSSTLRARGDQAVLAAEHGAIRLQLAADGGSPDPALAAAVVQDVRIAEDAYAQDATQRWGAVRSDQNLEAWGDYGSTMVARLRAAVIQDDAARTTGVASAAVDAFMSEQTHELHSSMADGSQPAAVVMGALLAEAGFASQAAQSLQVAGITLDQAELARLKRDLSAGRYTALEQLLRRIS